MRGLGTDHGSNPHLDSPLFGQQPYTRAEGLQMLRVEAWWDGWEEVNRCLSPRIETGNWMPF